MVKLRDVRSAFQQVNRDGSVLRIDSAGVRLPVGGHFQGIQVFHGQPDRVALSCSSDSSAHLVICVLANIGLHDGYIERVVRLATSPLSHAGGFQQIGQHFVVGLEDSHGKSRSEAQFWNLDGGVPAQLKKLTVERRTDGTAGMAGAVGIADVGPTMLLAVGSWGC